METDADDDVDDDGVIVAVCHSWNGTSLDQSSRARAQFYAGAK